MSKNVKIAVSAACIVLAGVIFYFTTLRGSVGSLGGGQILIKCFNPQCKQAYALTAEEAAKIQAEDLMALMPPAVGSPPTTVCIKCGKKTAYVAKKCDKCPEIFVRGEAGDRQYPDKCTKCGYSYAAELSKNQK